MLYDLPLMRDIMPKIDHNGFQRARAVEADKEPQAKTIQSKHAPWYGGGNMTSSEQSGQSHGTTRRDFLKNSAVVASAAVVGVNSIAHNAYATGTISSVSA